MVGTLTTIIGAQLGGSPFNYGYYSPTPPNSDGSFTRLHPAHALINQAGGVLNPASDDTFLASIGKPDDLPWDGKAASASLISVMKAAALAFSTAQAATGTATGAPGTADFSKPANSGLAAPIL